jgi:uncharacterized membrane protein
MHMEQDIHHLHVDEISVWSWVAAAAFALIALAAIMFGLHQNMQMASESPALPLTQPALVSPHAPADRDA